MRSLRFSSLVFLRGRVCWFRELNSMWPTTLSWGPFTVSATGLKTFVSSLASTSATSGSSAGAGAGSDSFSLGSGATGAWGSAGVADATSSLGDGVAGFSSTGLSSTGFSAGFASSSLTLGVTGLGTAGVTGLGLPAASKSILPNTFGFCPGTTVLISRDSLAAFCLAFSFWRSLDILSDLDFRSMSGLNSLTSIS